MGSFSTSLSGLDAEEQALSVISNDLSNLNTTAFKTGTPVFSDLFYQMLGTDGAGDPVQLGVGARMSSVSSPMTQGNVTSTGVPTRIEPCLMLPEAGPSSHLRCNPTQAEE